MKITIIACGKKHDPKLVAAISDYAARLRHYATLEWKLVDPKLTSSMSQNQICNSQSAAILQQIQPVDTVILLDERGLQLDSPMLAGKLQSYLNSSTRNLVIIIGGAYGVSQELSKRADFTWSLSKLVFPHQLVRLLLLEQLYRAYSILAGEKYHHN